MYRCSLENKYPDLEMLAMVFFLKKKKKKIVSTYLLAVLGLCCSVGFSLVAASGGYSLGVMHSLLIVMASLVTEHGLQGPWASVVVA